MKNKYGRNTKNINTNTEKTDGALVRACNEIERLEKELNTANETIHLQVEEIGRLNVLLSQAYKDRNDYKRAYNDLLGGGRNSDKATKLEEENTKLKQKNGELSARNCELAVENKQLRQLVQAKENEIVQLQNTITGLMLRLTGKFVPRETIWKQEIELGRLPKNGSEDIVYRYCVSDFGAFIDARIFNRYHGSPTRKGICLSLDKFAEFVCNGPIILERLDEILGGM